MTNIIVVKNEDARDLAQGSAWRIAYVVEYSGTYRLIYAAEALNLKPLEGKLPKSLIQKMRGELKDKYQKKTPPEVLKLLDAIFGDKFTARVPTGNHNPGKTNANINQAAGVGKYAGRVFIVVMLASELEKIRTADDWRRQLGSSSSGFIGSVVSGWAAGAATGYTTGKIVRNPWVVAGSTVVGGIIGGAIGYEIVSGFFEHLYDVYV